jgi:hypothetical protein
VPNANLVPAAAGELHGHRHARAQSDGTTTITVTVSDGSLAASDTFLLMVTPTIPGAFSP